MAVKRIRYVGGRGPVEVAVPDGQPQWLQFGADAVEVPEAFAEQLLRSPMFELVEGSPKRSASSSDDGGAAPPEQEA